tara:strand:+ start:275 stop:397 length:123 start_codon:yes stop_codon:yes gene_type:complete
MQVELLGQLQMDMQVAVVENALSEVMAETHQVQLVQVEQV